LDTETPVGASTVQADKNSVIYGNPLWLVFFAFEAIVIRGIASINLRATRARCLLSIHEQALRSCVSVERVTLIMARSTKIQLAQSISDIDLSLGTVETTHILL